MGLDTTNCTVGYLLGRLFCLLERIQEYSIVEGIGDGEERLYERALGNPAEVLAHLINAKGDCMRKLKNRNKFFIEELIAEILARLEELPVRLTVQDQLRFALGYHHQRQFLCCRKSQFVAIKKSFSFSSIMATVYHWR